MAIYVVDTVQGRSVKEAANLRAARSQARKEHGTLNFESAHKASMDELLQVKQFGGWLPVSVRAEVEQYELKMQQAGRA